MKIKPTETFFAHPYIGTALFCVVSCILVLWGTYTECGRFFYGDTDSYTRALRIFDWLKEDFQWSEKIFPWSNPPHGFNLHFTRAVDIVWLCFSLPLIFFMPLKEAVFYGGFFISPLFLILVMLVLVKCYLAFLPRMQNQKTCFLLGVLCTLMLLLKLTDIFDAYRPDHHALMCFVFTMNITPFLQGNTAHKTWHFPLIGALAALGLWASSAIEGLIVAGVIMLLLCFDWLIKKRTVNDIVFYSLGLFAATTFFWLINPPIGGFGVTDINRLSVIHTTLTALIFLAFLGISRLNPQSFVSKMAALITAFMATLILMFLLFGSKRLITPIYQEEIQQYFLPYIDEMQPAWKFAYLIPSYIIVTVEIALLLKFSKFKLHDLIDLAILTLIFGTLSLFVVRFYPYFAILFALTSTILFFVFMHFDSVAEQPNKTYKISAFSLLIGLVFYMFSFRSDVSKNCQISVQLPQNIVCLTDLFEAPRLIFEQNIDTIGSPYHSNIEGIINHHNLWYMQDEQKLQSLIRKYNVTCINKSVQLEGNQNSLSGIVKQQTPSYKWLTPKEGYFEVDLSKF